MENTKDILLAEESRLERIVQSTKEQLKNAPEGTLRLSNNKSGRMFYHCNDRKIYIPKGNQELICALAQKSYNEKILKEAEKCLSKMKKINQIYEGDKFEQIYLDEHPDRRQFIKPIEPTWEQQLEEWKSKEYKGLGFNEEAPVILTEKGERVRSKTEKIMADYFYRNGIEYKYECPLYLKGWGIAYPDFTFLSRKSRQEIYMEHFGKADDPIYARKMVKKIGNYEENGIFVGERLIVTYETEQTVLGTKQLERLMKKYVI